MRGIQLYRIQTTLGFPSKEGLKRASRSGGARKHEGPLWDFHQKKDWNIDMFARNGLNMQNHFGISIKRRIETLPHWRSSYLQQQTTLGFPSKEGLKRTIIYAVLKIRKYHFGISIKRRIETYFNNVCNPKRILTTLGFPSKEGLKPIDGSSLAGNLETPLWDFHQKKDWNLSWNLEMGFPASNHFGISIKRRIETRLMAISDSHASRPLWDFHQKKDWNRITNQTI